MIELLVRASFLALLGLTLTVGNIAVADPADGFCDGLDPAGQLFSTCIQAHSALNRLEHLEQVGASENAIARAELAYSAALATYKDLPGGGAVPGLETDYPLLAVAYINSNGVDGYQAGGGNPDTLIAKIIDIDLSGDVNAGDLIYTDRYPKATDASTVGTFQHTSHEIQSVNNTGIPGLIEVTSSTFTFQFVSGFSAPDCHQEKYSEQGTAEGGAPATVFVDQFTDTSCGLAVGDYIETRVLSPSEPDSAVQVSVSDYTDNIFIDVDIF